MFIPSLSHVISSHPLLCFPSPSPSLTFPHVSSPSHLLFWSKSYIHLWLCSCSLSGHPSSSLVCYAVLYKTDLYMFSLDQFIFLITPLPACAAAFIAACWKDGEMQKDAETLRKPDSWLSCCSRTRESIGGKVVTPWRNFKKRCT